MSPYPHTTIIRHRKENRKKCSLRGLEGRDDMRFLSYPSSDLPSFAGYILLTLDAPPLSPEDNHLPLLLLDATWRYADKMLATLSSQLHNTVPRSLPAELRTAYPRRQDDCFDPSRGLASAEALYAAYSILGRPTDGLLDSYFWKEDFLDLNKKFL